MRKISVFALGIIAMVAFSGCGAASTVSIAPTNLQPGMQVAASSFVGQDLYLFTLGTTEDNGENYNSKTFEGRDESLEKAAIVYVFPPKLDLKVGDAVVAPNTFFMGALLKATVKEVKASAYTLTWDPSKPGLDDEDVPFGRVLPANLVDYKCSNPPCNL